MKALLFILSLLTALQIFTGCSTVHPTQSREISSSEVEEEAKKKENSDVLPANLGPQTRSLHNGLR
jgi:hypothetical protein